MQKESEVTRLVKVAFEDHAIWGILDDDRVYRLEGDPYEIWAKGAALGEAASMCFIAPATPTKVVCVGRNYVAHAAEHGVEVPSEPLLFLKPPSCLIPHRAEIEFPENHEKADFEGEIALVIGERCRNVPEERALDYLLGVTAYNDVTERVWQKGDGQWTRGKGCDTFGPCGPFIDTSAAEALREGGESRTPLTLTTFLNGEQVQYGEIKDLTFGFAFLISYISKYMTLEAGDIIATGTPAGVGQLRAGDEVAVELSCGVRLENAVRG